MITGNITAASTIFGNQDGIPHGMAFSYDATNTAHVNNVANITTFDAGTVFSLQASASATATGQTNYQWSVGPGVNVGIVDPVSPQTRIALSGPPGDYPVTLTVTNPYETVTTTVTVHYAPAGN